MIAVFILLFSIIASVMTFIYGVTQRSRLLILLSLVSSIPLLIYFAVTPGLVWLVFLPVIHLVVIIVLSRNAHRI